MEEEDKRTALSLLELPEELILLVFSFLDVSSFLRLSYTCTTLHNLSQDNYAWAALIHRHLTKEEIDDLLAIVKEKQEAKGKKERQSFLPIKNENKDLAVFG